MGDATYRTMPQLHDLSLMDGLPPPSAALPHVLRRQRLQRQRRWQTTRACVDRKALSAPTPLRDGQIVKQSSQLTAFAASPWTLKTMHGNIVARQLPRHNTFWHAMQGSARL